MHGPSPLLFNDNKNCRKLSCQFHETLFTLYGRQFSELFAYTLQNCLWNWPPSSLCSILMLSELMCHG